VTASFAELPKLCSPIHVRSVQSVELTDAPDFGVQLVALPSNIVKQLTKAGAAYETGSGLRGSLSQCGVCRAA